MFHQQLFRVDLLLFEQEVVDEQDGDQRARKIEPTIVRNWMKWPIRLGMDRHAGDRDAPPTMIFHGSILGKTLTKEIAEE